MQKTTTVLPQLASVFEEFLVYPSEPLASRILSCFFGGSDALADAPWLKMEAKLQQLHIHLSWVTRLQIHFCCPPFFSCL
jgi:hypothetical protein